MTDLIATVTAAPLWSSPRLHRAVDQAVFFLGAFALTVALSGTLLYKTDYLGTAPSDDAAFLLAAN